MSRNLNITEQVVELPAVGSCRVQKNQRHTTACFFVIDSPGFPILIGEVHVPSDYLRRVPLSRRSVLLRVLADCLSAFFVPFPGDFR